MVGQINNHLAKRKKGNERTSKQVIFEAPSEHKFVDKQPVIVLTAIPNQLHQIGMPELPQKVDLRLEKQKPRKENE